MGLITNGEGQHQRRKLEALNVFGLVDEQLIFISGEIGYAKPDGRLFEHVNKQTETVAENSYYIEIRGATMLPERWTQAGTSSGLITVRHRLNRNISLILRHGATRKSVIFLRLNRLILKREHGESNHFQVLAK